MSKSMKYITKPLIVEAFKYGVDPHPDWFQDKVASNEVSHEDGDCFTASDRGLLIAMRGEYIIKGVNGDIHFCTPELFDKCYRRAEQFDETSDDAINQLNRLLKGE